MIAACYYLYNNFFGFESEQAASSLADKRVKWNGDWDRRDRNSVVDFLNANDCEDLSSVNVKNQRTTKDLVIVSYGAEWRKASCTAFEQMSTEIEYIKSKSRLISQTCGTEVDCVGLASKLYSASQEINYSKLLNRDDMEVSNNRGCFIAHARLESAFRNFCTRSLYPFNTVQVLVCSDQVKNYIVQRSLQIPIQTFSYLAPGCVSITHLQFRGNGNVDLASYQTFP